MIKNKSKLRQLIKFRANLKLELQKSVIDLPVGDKFKEEIDKLFKNKS